MSWLRDDLVIVTAPGHQLAGNVVSMRARGKNLERELQKLMGPPLAAADMKADDSVAPASHEEAAKEK